MAADRGSMIEGGMRGVRLAGGRIIDDGSHFNIGPNETLYFKPKLIVSEIKLISIISLS